MIEKDRDNDKERGQGQLEARASPEKVEKEVKKTRGTSHPKKFEARAPDGYHRDYILLLCDGLACKSSLFFFPSSSSSSSFSDSRIVSHSSFACKWQNRLWDSELVIAHFPDNKGGTSNI